MIKYKTVSVIGLGYIGLPTAAILASRGLKVLGVDVNKQVVDTISQGSIHIVEPDLDIIVRSVVQTGNLKADIKISPADVFLIAVPTPLDDNNSPNISFIKAAAKSIAPLLEKGNLVILESTSPVGTTQKLSEWLAAERLDLAFPANDTSTADIYIAYCPERVLPGQVLHELVSNDRLVGGLTNECAIRAVAFYEVFVKGEFHLTNARTAEMAKLTENAFRDVNIAFANELSVICDTHKIDVWELIKLANKHPRVSILNPGPGVGGHCIAVDPWFIINSDVENSKLIKAARTVNDRMPYYVIDKVCKAASRFKKPIIACLGLSFKADIDDLRESPALKIVEALAKGETGELLVVEPNIDELPNILKGNLRKVDLSEALSQADIILLLVGHREFRKIELGKLNRYVTIDTIGMLDD